MTTNTVTESLVDAKDEAVKGTLRSEVSHAVAELRKELAEFRKDLHSQTLWIVGWVTLVGGAIIAVLR